LFSWLATYGYDRCVIPAQAGMTGYRFDNLYMGFNLD